MFLFTYSILLVMMKNASNFIIHFPFYFSLHLMITQLSIMNFREQIISFKNDKVFIIFSVCDKLVILFMELLSFHFIFSKISESKDIFFIHSGFFQLDILTRILKKMILKSDHMFLIYVHGIFDIGECVRHRHFGPFFV